MLPHPSGNLFWKWDMFEKTDESEASEIMRNVWESGSGQKCTDGKTFQVNHFWNDIFFR